jgi:ATP adenylyltransferase/5',5'''-P-1,P-4-tetraphosphate phosphorylase II
MVMSTKVTNMSVTIGKGKEGTSLTFLPSLLVQRKRKRHLEKKSDEQSARPSTKKRRG